MLVLIIDDDVEDGELFCEVVKKILPEDECIMADSCEVGIAKIQDNAQVPTYIFLDGSLYGTYSHECLINLKNNERLNNTSFIIYSGFVIDSMKAKYREIGIDDIIIKPSTYVELEAILRKIILSKHK